MSKSKNYNRIVFLTTLSVYLGLVLVGGTAPVLAQNSKKSDNPNKISIFAPSVGSIFTFDLNPIIELNTLADNKPLPIKISGKLIPSHQKLTNWEIISSTGNQNIINFLQKEFFTPAELDPPEQPLFAAELFQSVEIDKDTITFTRNTKYNDAGKAAEMAYIFRQMSESAKSPTAKKEIAGNLYLTNTEARAENNQVFIVTRLPRAALNELFAGKDAQQ